MEKTELTAATQLPADEDQHPAPAHNRGLWFEAEDYLIFTGMLNIHFAIEVWTMPKSSGNLF